ncbi:uncharacterized protein LOC133283855 [Gastrolobium bilobum]|uniref:uncharacterized protein LOC133283855 n=1 Tax=Gastrolobium bilobum TaxID=150636 RepID=UPI002AB1DEF7|nr:uncharacterized protein LOC133283855 [Gastrolobium bilobum]
MTFSRLVEYFVKRREEIEKDVSQGWIISKKAEAALQKNDELAGTYRVRIFDSQLLLFEVEDAYNQSTHEVSDTMRVDLINHKCQCGRFTEMRYPCSHVLAVCKAARLNHYDYVDPVFKIQTITKVYAAHWYPIGNEMLIPSVVGPTVIPDVSERTSTVLLCNVMVMVDITLCFI